MRISGACALRIFEVVLEYPGVAESRVHDDVLVVFARGPGSDLAQVVEVQEVQGPRTVPMELHLGDFELRIDRDDLSDLEHWTAAEVDEPRGRGEVVDVVSV